MVRDGKSKKITEDIWKAISMVENLFQNEFGECKEEELEMWGPARNRVSPSSLLGT